MTRLRLPEAHYAVTLYGDDLPGIALQVITPDLTGPKEVSFRWETEPAVGHIRILAESVLAVCKELRSQYPDFDFRLHVKWSGGPFNVPSLKNDLDNLNIGRE